MAGQKDANLRDQREYVRARVVPPESASSFFLLHLRGLIVSHLVPTAGPRAGFFRRSAAAFSWPGLTVIRKTWFWRAH